MVTRQDAWTNEEDLLLTEVVLRHIREGGTQLSAFKEVGQLLSRTSAACGFRWNSYVRKIQENHIEEAKKYRKSFMKKKVKIVEEKEEPNHLPKQLVVDFLIEWLEKVRENDYEVFHLYEEYHRVREENVALVNKLKILEKEYLTFLDFVDKKRTITESNFNLYTE